MEHSINNSGKSEEKDVSQLKYQGNGTFWYQPDPDRLYHILNIDERRDAVRVRLSLEFKGERVHQDMVNLTSERRRVEFSNKCPDCDSDIIKTDLFNLLSEIEKREHVVKTDDNDPPPLTQQQKADALEFLRQPNLIERIEFDLEELGIIGERNLALIIFLVMTSRLLGGIEWSRSMPLGVYLKGDSSTGKSKIMSTTLKLFPSHEVVDISSMSEKALVYSGKDRLRHKVVVVAEQAGAQQSEYFLRILLSEGKINHLVTIQDPATGRFESIEVEARGPVALVISTTTVSLNQENRSRILEVYPDASAEQTGKVLKYQATNRSHFNALQKCWGEATIRLHQNAQRMLRPAVVEIPYARHILLDPKRCGPVARRHQEKIFSLIDAVALLRQYQKEEREKDGVLVISADLEDYRIVHRLLTHAIPDMQGNLDRRGQLVMEAAKDLTPPNQFRWYGFTRAELMEATHLSEHIIRQLTKQLVDRDHLEIIDGGSGGRPYSFKVKKPLPEIDSELPTPEELEERLEKEQQSKKESSAEEEADDPETDSPDEE
ncbi:hypothetical protein ACFL3H_00315 [Gemmatimonadota bacterium]